MAGAATETYVAYGVTEKLFKECARQADYSVPQALEKGAVVPKSEAGEDLGVGEGWWYRGMRSTHTHTHTYASSYRTCVAKPGAGATPVRHRRPKALVREGNRKERKALMLLPAPPPDLSLPPTFSTWAQVTFLHMYVLTVRFRRFPASHAPAWHQHLLDHFFFDAEGRMVKFHGLAANSVRQRYLKDLFVQWRGVLAAYDEGLVRGDAVLATAVWRNVFRAAAEVDPAALASVVAFLRREVRAVDRMADEDVAAGEIRFGRHAGVEELVQAESEMMRGEAKEGGAGN